MEVLTSDHRAPRHLRIPESVLEELVWDPVMAVWVFFKIRLDAFQSARLRLMWFSSDVEDSSGFSTGKTFVNWAVCQLRAILISDHRVLVIFPTFQTGKDQYWSYYASMRTPIFRAQLGRFTEDGDEKARAGIRDPAAWKMHYRNGSLVNMPAPSVAQESRTLASLRCNTLLVDEHTKVAAANADTFKQLLGRATRECWNKHHPVWANKVIRTATAEGAQHPAYPSHLAIERRQRRGDPDVAAFAFSYKDYSDLPSAEPGKTFKEKYRDDKRIRALRDSLTPEAFLAEGLGMWGLRSKGWFSPESIEAAVALGAQRRVMVATSRAMDVANG